MKVTVVTAVLNDAGHIEQTILSVISQTDIEIEYIIVDGGSKDGTLESRAIHQFGSATQDVHSKHYADQVPLFARRETRPVWMDESEIRKHLEREYRPGE